MKNRAIILCSIGLLIGATASAQKTVSAGISPKAGISTDLLGNKPDQWKYDHKQTGKQAGKPTVKSR